MAVLAGEGGLAEAAGAERGGDHGLPAGAVPAAPRPAGGEDGVQRAELRVPADEVLVTAGDIPRREIGERDAVEPGGDAPVQRGEALGEGAWIVRRIARGVFDLQRAGLGVELFEDFRPLVEPRLQLAIRGAVPAVEVGEPGGELLILPGGEIARCDEEDGRDAVIAAGVGVLAAEVLVPLPEAVFRGDVVRREEGEEEARGADARAEIAPPVASLDDGFFVEEHLQLAPGVGLVPALDLALKSGDPALALGVDGRFIVLAGVGEEDVIVHGREPYGRCRSVAGMWETSSGKWGPGGRCKKCSVRSSRCSV